MQSETRSSDGGPGCQIKSVTFEVMPSTHYSTGQPREEEEPRNTWKRSKHEGSRAGVNHAAIKKFLILGFLYSISVLRPQIPALLTLTTALTHSQTGPSIFPTLMSSAQATPNSTTPANSNMVYSQYTIISLAIFNYVIEIII